MPNSPQARRHTSSTLVPCSFCFSVKAIWSSVNLLVLTTCSWPLQALNMPVVGGSPCVNPIDEITVSPGSAVKFSGRGSSDADTSDYRPTHWMWDFDANSIDKYFQAADHPLPKDVKKFTIDDVPE